MAPSAEAEQPVVEIDGLLWETCPGAEATAAESQKISDGDVENP
ncbi:hypothetical protein [Micromonospora sp. NPDC048063]